VSGRQSDLQLSALHHCVDPDFLNLIRRNIISGRTCLAQLAQTASQTVCPAALSVECDTCGHTLVIRRRTTATETTCVRMAGSVLVQTEFVRRDA
jgi:hypothetical protein